MKFKPPYNVDEVPLPKKWDFVWCLYPHAEKPAQPGPYPRPCLVKDAGIASLTDGGSVPFVTVVYCTKQIDLLDEYSFIIDDPDQMKQCGLFEETLVVTNKIIRPPWSPSFFKRRERDNIGPVIGKLPVELRSKVTALIPGF
ncbi:hypothetical protein GFM07_38595 [Rhizobium leguminosarum bv. viciae]|nr:hypothetical protein [Rhizobium leguminosarum bv. viciae]